MPIKIAVSRGGAAHVDKAATAAIVRTITDNEIRVASFDPLVAHHAAVENATGDMDLVIREFARIANATDCAIEIVHHTRKLAPGQEEFGVVDSRGAGAIVNAVRSARVLNPMSKSEADGAGSTMSSASSISASIAARPTWRHPTAARWFRFVGVVLPNETADDIGVATPGRSPGRPGRPRRSSPRPSARPRRCSCRCWHASLTRPRVGANPSSSYAPGVFARERAAKAARIGSPRWFSDRSAIRGTT